MPHRAWAGYGGGTARPGPTTAVAIALAVVLLVVRGAIPGHEIVQPMTLVVLGSLVTATLLNLSVTSPST